MNDDTKDLPFQGSEKRKDNRRQLMDRRQEIRFEPNKEDRRINSVRRKIDHDPWFRHND